MEKGINPSTSHFLPSVAQYNCRITPYNFTTESFIECGAIDHRAVFTGRNKAPRTR
jgi:hypothetical protein